MNKKEYQKRTELAKAGFDRKQVFLPQEEYAMVMSELNTHLTEEERTHKIVSKAIGSYVYTAINQGFNEYVIIGKYAIESVDEEWEDS